MSVTDKDDIMALADEAYPIVELGSYQEPVVATHAQMTSLFRKWKQDQQGLSWRDFCKTVQATFGMDHAIVVRWCGMWLAIERDGYTHT